MDKKPQIKQAVILAGGKGLRLRPLTKDRPKVMVLVNKYPFVKYLIDLLKENGIQEIVFLVGYKYKKIEEYLGDGSRFGLCIKYSRGNVSDETGTRIRNAHALLEGEFLLIYSDNYWSLNLRKLYKFHQRHKKLVTLTVYSNKANITKNNVYTSYKGAIEKYDRKRETSGLNGVEIGFYIINKKILRHVPKSNFSFEEKMLPLLISKGQLAGYVTRHKYYSIGDPRRLKIAGKFLRGKKVILLDRDGVINQKPAKEDYVKSWKEFRFIDGVIESLALLAKNNFDIYIISNQAGIDRGLMTERDLTKIHFNLQTVLAKHGVKIKGIYYCPHHWDKNCECRKPKPGLFFKAADENYFDLTKAIFIGDDTKDLKAGIAAGCKTFLLAKNDSLFELIKSVI